MRLFTGIYIPETVTSNLDRLLKRLQPAARIKWSPVENLHITTKFIGEWADERLKELEAALRTVPSIDPMDIAISGLGWFPNPHHPRVFWAAIHAPESLPKLARATEEALAGIGVPVEDRPFSPHLTLARIKDPVPLAALRQAVIQLDSVDFGAFHVEAFCLYRSQVGRAGSVYTKLAEFPLTHS